MPTSRQVAFERIAAELGYDFGGAIKIGGNYAPFVIHRNEVYVSGQIPRVADTVMVTGRVGAMVSLPQAQLAARICAMRALALLRQAAGDLARIERILRITVFVQCSDDFTQHSEVADAASEVLHAVLGDAGMHTRTSVGVLQLPKNAAVEMDLVAAIA
ncbi:enamine deaminase RidA (YjgF/YER057c/UK114 family) [Actimicrobium sp. GrIS 1.19]|uniref:RidA family protein n=1 Tax=Actimicrobium sp. GrIS 1.19 TaxID=3071708 RepID=UPI002DF90D9D|nr:enamine deaminase RidA (YjgF/YER057c/UK114 family) [Actimicrobium sp. GrIS 1.19]